ncbi:unnamed protein product [Urochloa humidicola]
MAGDGSVADWWSSQGAGQLGPEWLSSVLAAATAPPTTSTGNHATVGETYVVEPEAIPVRGGPARRRGGRGGRGGRAPRPPPPILAAPPASIDVEAVEADWCDENTRIVCEIFADEVQKGHRDTTHLNKTGYQNIIKRFKERIGLVYCRRQFKNRWDKLKKRLWYLETTYEANWFRMG